MTDKNIEASRYFQKLGFTVSLLDEELTLPLHRFSEVEQAIQQELLKARLEGYKKGYIDCGIEQINKGSL